MATFQIYSGEYDCGLYRANSKEEALDLWAQDQEFEDYADAMRVVLQDQTVIEAPMTTFRIFSGDVDCGAFEAHSDYEALDIFAQGIGYKDYAHLCEVAPREVTWVEEAD